MEKPNLEVGPGDFGNLQDPELSGLPSAVANLDGAGAAEAWQQLGGKPQLSGALANQLRTNPKALILHTFNLTALQRVALWQMSSAELNEQLTPLANAIQANNVAGITLTIGEPTFTVEPHGEFIPALNPVHSGPVVNTACKWKLTIQFTISNE